MPITTIKLLWVLVLAHIVITWALAIRRGLRARQRDKEQPTRQAIDLPPVSIIVPAWNEKGTIEPCARSLQAIDYPDWEAIILAGGDDGTYEISKQIVDGDNRFRVIEREPEPKNVALTRGFEVARYDVLVILDADSIVETGWLTALVTPLLEGAAASFGMHQPITKTWISMAEYMDVFLAYHILGTELAQGCSSLAIWRTKMNEIGPLPTNAFSWEDWDIAVRLVNAGESVCFAPKARLLTSRPSSLKEYWPIIVRSYTSHLAGMWHHRAVFFKRSVWAIRELYFTVFSTALVLATMGGIVTIIINPMSAPTIFMLAIILAVWIAGRRAAIGAEIATYTSDPAWLLHAWAPVALLPVQFAAASLALLRVRRQPSFDYKGPRTGPLSEIEDNSKVYSK